MNLKTFTDIQTKFEEALEAQREVCAALTETGYRVGSRDHTTAQGLYHLMELAYDGWQNETREAFQTEWKRDAENRKLFGGVNL